jgi:predicted CXXCH cytochrome family protein
MSVQLPDPKARPRWPRRLAVAVLGLGAVVLALVLASRLPLTGWFESVLLGPPPPPPPGDLSESSRPLASGRRLTVWWDSPPPGLQMMVAPTGAESNIHPADYVGPEACQKCHAANYRTWSDHPHRWMNALADATTVKGDFAGGNTVSYLGGKATFFRTDDGYGMRLERGGVRRQYAVTQTIGSRFFQYYVGKQTEGPEPAGHHFYAKDHVLPFGYWLDEKEWVPTVHIGPERRDGQRPDPFDPPASGQYYAEYAVGCNSCHTTFPLGDLMARKAQQVGDHAPRSLHWSVRKYLESAHPAEAKAIGESPPHDAARNALADWDAPHYAVTLGVSCESCHLGGRRHVESEGRDRPAFFPRSPFLLVEARGEEMDPGRSHDNVNWACGRCHTGPRPAFAAGQSTWNSVEYADAMRGGCYSQARCVDCHNPHRAIGPRWSASAGQDDAVCLKCHRKFEPAAERVHHTHHPVGSDGARCMNCHMPRLNEGLQDVVRTHMIFSPTRADMIEANHPNACNQCHTDRPIDWTLDRLKEWYGKRYDDKKIAANYPDRAGPVALGWVNSDNESVRLVGADSLARAHDPQSLPQLLRALDDPFLINRQFAGRRLQEMLNVRLSDHGYRFYMTAEERETPLADLRKKFLR